MLLRVGVLGLMGVLAAIEPEFHGVSGSHYNGETEGYWPYWIWLAIGYGSSVLLAWWWGKRSDPAYAGWVQLGVDTILAAVIVQLSGGLSSEFSLLYLVAIAASASHGKSSQCWVSLGACAITYCTLGTFELLNWIEVSPPNSEPLPYGSRLLAMARNLGAMLAITVFAARLTRSWQEAHHARINAEKRQAQGRSKIQELQRDLEHSERMAAIGQLAATVAHEIRNPLAAMSGCVELLALDLDAKEKARLLEVINREVRRLNTTVQQLLDYARPGTPDKLPGDLVTVVSQVIEAFGQDPQRQALQVVQTGVETALGCFEHESIAQVLWNLLHNAAQAQQNQGRIEVRVGGDEGHIELCVIDQGCGIDPEVSARVFEPYYTTKSEGSGFGLAVVAKIVERHRGEIEILPQAQGSCFSIRWPREAQAAPEPGYAQAA